MFTPAIDFLIIPKSFKLLNEELLNTIFQFEAKGTFRDSKTQYVVRGIINFETQKIERLHIVPKQHKKEV